MDAQKDGVVTKADLANLLKDVELNASGIMSNLKRVKSKLFMRNKFAEKGKLTAKIDMKIW